MTVRPGVACAVALLTGCIAPTSRPITAPVPAGRQLDVQARAATIAVQWRTAPPPDAPPCRVARVTGTLGAAQGPRFAPGDSIRFSSITTIGTGCVGRGAAIVVLPADPVTVEELVEASFVTQVVGSTAIIYAVAAFSLLLYNAADGIVDAIGRWF